MSTLARRRAGRTARDPIVVVVALIAVLGAVAFAGIYSYHLPPRGGDPIRSDGVGYYLYLPAVFLDHDVSMRHIASHSFAVKGGTIGSLQRESNGRFLDQYGIGEAVLMTPFFGAGELLATLTGERQDGFSWPYQAAAAAAGLFYMLAGLLVLASVLRLWFDRTIVAITLVAITFGTDLFSYGTFDAVFSHAYSFFLIAAMLRLVISMWRSPSGWAAVALGLTAGLVCLVRPTNLTILVFCVLVGIKRPRDLLRRVATIAARWRLLALGSAAFLVAVAPELWYWHAITGHYLVNAYPSAHGELHLLSPHLVGVLFSVRKGLFFWSPLLVLATVGLVLLGRRAPGTLVPATAYLIAAVWVVSSWSYWSYGPSFGMRALIESLPVFALGLAALLDRCRALVPRVTVEVLVVLTVLLSVHAMLAYWGGGIPEDGTTIREYLASF